MNSLVKINHKLVNDKSNYDITLKISGANGKQFGLLFRAFSTYQAYLKKYPETLNMPGDTEIELDALKMLLEAWRKRKYSKGSEGIRG